MKKKNKRQTEFSGTAYVAESPAERMAFGTMKTILGILIVLAVLITVAGAARFGLKGFFKRMGNTVHSFSSDYYDIRVDRGENISGTQAIKTDADNRTIAMNIKQENGSITMPGAYGTTTFYIIPKDTDEDLSIKIRLNAFGLTMNENGEYTRVTDKNVDELINGHILFFEDNENGYKGLLDNGELTYNTADHKADLLGDEYKVTVYWIWPEYYEQMVDHKTEGALFTNEECSAEMTSYIEKHPNRFFYSKNSEKEEKTDLYNNGDVLIYKSSPYFGFEIIAEN